MTSATMDSTEVGFRYIHLDQVDPNFTLIDPGFYNLKVISAELKEFDKTATGGKAGEFIKFVFSVTDDPKFTGRRVFPDAMFFNDFTLKTLRRIQDATGIPQDGDIVGWLKALTAVGPVLKLKVDIVPDVYYKTGEPNPRTVQPDGTPAKKQIIDWRAGVQSEG